MAEQQRQDRAARRCARVGCGDPAEATLTADYEGRTMAVGPLSPEHHPPALDLCARHRETLRPPDGWQLIRHDPRRGRPQAPNPGPATADRP